MPSLQLSPAASCKPRSARRSSERFGCFPGCQRASVLDADEATADVRPTRLRFDAFIVRDSPVVWLVLTIPRRAGSIWVMSNADR